MGARGRWARYPQAPCAAAAASSPPRPSPAPLCWAISRGAGGYNRQSRSAAPQQSTVLGPQPAGEQVLQCLTYEGRACSVRPILQRQEDDGAPQHRGRQHIARGAGAGSGRRTQPCWGRWPPGSELSPSLQQSSGWRGVSRGLVTLSSPAVQGTHTPRRACVPMGGARPHRQLHMPLQGGLGYSGLREFLRSPPLSTAGRCAHSLPRRSGCAELLGFVAPSVQSQTARSTSPPAHAGRSG